MNIKWTIKSNKSFRGIIILLELVDKNGVIYGLYPGCIMSEFKEDIISTYIKKSIEEFKTMNISNIPKYNVLLIELFKAFNN